MVAPQISLLVDSASTHPVFKPQAVGVTTDLSFLPVLQIQPSIKTCHLSNEGILSTPLYLPCHYHSSSQMINVPKLWVFFLKKQICVEPIVGEPVHKNSMIKSENLLKHIYNKYLCHF